jgi:hypothetical protein
VSASQTGSEADKSPTQRAGKKPSKDADRLRFLADRTAILLCVCIQRYGGDLNPFFREGLYEDEGSLGDEVRDWPQYESAMEIVRLWLRKHDKRVEDEAAGRG